MAASACMAGISDLAEKKCENCGWWEAESYEKTCVMFDDGKHKAKVRGVDSEYGDLIGYVVTDPDFYCNEWKAKE